MSEYTLIWRRFNRKCLQLHGRSKGNEKEWKGGPMCRDKVLFNLQTCSTALQSRAITFSTTPVRSLRNSISGQCQYMDILCTQGRDRIALSVPDIGCPQCSPVLGAGLCRAQAGLGLCCEGIPSPVCCGPQPPLRVSAEPCGCLLYTSDAADE